MASSLETNCQVTLKLLEFIILVLIMYERHCKVMSRETMERGIPLHEGGWRVIKRLRNQSMEIMLLSFCD